MADKSLVNSVEKCAEESLAGFSALRPDLAVDLERKIVVDESSCVDGKVAVISGGGSGHEPFPTGYVGKGMLAASVSGDTFASPPSSNILSAVQVAAHRSSGVLLLVPNYTGDVLNFGLAAEMAAGEGIQVESVRVGEDAATENSGPGRRGMCGLVLVAKIAGYLSDSGSDLATVKKWSEEAARSSASMGVCMTACSKPGRGLLFHLKENEMEVGVGVHGEAGVARVEMKTARDTVHIILDRLLRSLKVTDDDEVVAVVNNLGALSHLEQWLLAGELQSQLVQRGVKVARLYAGHFFTSLNMAGVQLSMLKLEEGNRETFLTALDHPTAASSWTHRNNHPRTLPKTEILFATSTHRVPKKGPQLNPRTAEILKLCFLKISENLVKEEEKLNYLDSACGDGDCGSSFVRLATLIRENAEKWNFLRPVSLFNDLCTGTQRSVGGTTGAVYGLFFRGCSQELEKSTQADSPEAVSKCWRMGVEAIKKYSSARIGDRTMVDSLETGCRVFELKLKTNQEKPLTGFREAVKAATEARDRTKDLEAMAGRASYTARCLQKDVDAGAHAVTVWLHSILQVLDESWPSRDEKPRSK